MRVTLQAPLPVQQLSYPHPFRFLGRLHCICANEFLAIVDILAFPLQSPSPLNHALVLPEISSHPEATASVTSLVQKETWGNDREEIGSGNPTCIFTVSRGVFKNQGEACTACVGLSRSVFKDSEVPGSAHICSLREHAVGGRVQPVHLISALSGSNCKGEGRKVLCGRPGELVLLWRIKGPVSCQPAHLSRSILQREPGLKGQH